MNDRRIRRILFGLLSGVLAAGTAAPARAQAWLPPKGEASFSLGYGNVFVNKHYLGTSAGPGDNVESDFGHIRSQSVEIGLGYGLTDRLAASVAIPYILTKYYGTPGQNFFPHTISVDDGQYHGIFQDFKINLSYQALQGRVAVAPFVSAVIPSHSYTYFAHSAAGKGLREYLVGTSFGARLDQLLAGSYVFLEVGYYVTPSLSLRGIGTAVYTHGGLVLREADVLPPPEVFLHHDQIDHESGISLGGGVSYVLTGS